MIDMNEQEIQLVSGGNGQLTPDPNWSGDPVRTDPFDFTVEEAI